MPIESRGRAIFQFTGIRVPGYSSLAGQGDWTKSRPTPTIAPFEVGSGFFRFPDPLRIHLQENRSVEGIDWVMVVFRWMHILAAITAVGATIFMRQAMLPAVETLPESDRARFHDGVRSRWALYIHLSIGFLLLSGAYSFFVIITGDPRPKAGLYHGLFGIKFLLALAIFFIASMLVGRTEAAVRFRQRRQFWLTVNVVLAVFLVCISGVMRFVPRERKKAENPATAMRLEINTLRSPTSEIRLDLKAIDARATDAGHRYQVVG